MPRAKDPTPGEIEQRAAEIRQGWDAAEFAKRRKGILREEYRGLWEVPVVAEPSAERKAIEGD